MNLENTFSRLISVIPQFDGQGTINLGQTL